MSQSSGERGPDREDEDLALLEALGVPGAPRTLCECGHSWEWHRAPEAMGPCQFVVGYRAPLGRLLPFRIPLWLRKRDGCPRYRPAPQA